MPIDLVIDERDGGTKMESGEPNSNPDLRMTLTPSKRLIKLNGIFCAIQFTHMSNSDKT